MTQNKMEGINEETVNQVCEGVANSNGNVIVKLLIGAVGVAVGFGAVMFVKNRKRKQTIDAEVIEVNPSEETE